MIGFILLSLLSFSFPQTLYNGLVNYGGRVMDCGHILGRYVHGGVPSRKEDTKVKLCCFALREILRKEGSNSLLLAHLKVCRQLGR